MAKVRYTGPEGVVRHNDKLLKPGDVLEVNDDHFDGYMELGAGPKPDGTLVAGHFECVEAPKPKPKPKTEASSSSDETETPNPSAAAGDEKE